MVTTWPNILQWQLPQCPHTGVMRDTLTDVSTADIPSWQYPCWWNWSVTNGNPSTPACAHAQIKNSGSIKYQYLKFISANACQQSWSNYSCTLCLTAKELLWGYHVTFLDINKASLQMIVYMLSFPFKCINHKETKLIVSSIKVTMLFCLL